MAADDNEVFVTRTLLREQSLIARSDKSVAYVTNNTRAQLLPRMADRTEQLKRLCLHRRCVEYLATGNFYLLA